MLDDILIYSANEEQHAEHLHQVLSVLATTPDSTPRHPNAEFFKSTIEFLGQQILNGGMTPTEAKMQAIVTGPPHRTCMTCEPFWALQITTT